MNQHAQADSLFIEAIDNYKQVVDEADEGLATLYSNLASSLAKEQAYKESNRVFMAGIAIMEKDTSEIQNKNYLASDYQKLAKNLLAEDHLENAMTAIERALYFADKNEESYYVSVFYYGICLYKSDQYQKVDSTLQKHLADYQNLPTKNLQNLAEFNLLLGLNQMTLAKYKEARKYIHTALEITSQNFGPNSIQYANPLKLMADLNKIEGDYALSEKQYHQIIEIYKREPEEENPLFPNVLVGLSDLDITLSKLEEAKNQVDKALSLFLDVNPKSLNYPSATEMLNQAAYVDYHLGRYQSADTLYQKSIQINRNFGLGSNLSTAKALNGLALNEAAKKNYTKADSLFQESLIIHHQVLTDHHPLTASVYLNYGSLMIQEGKLSDAEEKINKALQINKQFFNPDHDIFGDIELALGDLAKKKGQKEQANIYYKKALEIYKNKFDQSHLKIRAAQQKINQ